MTLKVIASRNLWRRKGKTLFVVSGLAIGVATAVAVITIASHMTAEINDNMERFGANILIVPETDRLSLSYGGISLGGLSVDTTEIRQEDVQRIMTIHHARNIAALGPMVLGAVSMNGKQVLLAGVDHDSTPILKPWWRIEDGRYPAQGSMLLGSEAARVTGLSVGDSVRLGGILLSVAGRLAATGSQDDQLVFTDIATAQEVLHKKGLVSMVEVAALCGNCPVEEMVAEIAKVIPSSKVMAIQQVVKSRMAALAHFRKLAYGVSSAVLLVGCLFVMVTLMGSVRERTGEIGIFRAIGFRKNHVMGIVFLEAGVISLAAGVIGYALGVAGATAGLRFLANGIPFSGILDFRMASVAVLSAMVLGFVSSAYPALVAANLDPNEALRTL